MISPYKAILKDSELFSFSIDTKIFLLFPTYRRNGGFLA